MALYLLYGEFTLKNTKVTCSKCGGKTEIIGDETYNEEICIKCGQFTCSCFCRSKTPTSKPEFEVRVHGNRYCIVTPFEEPNDVFRALKLITDKWK